MIIAVASEDGINVAEYSGRCTGFVIFEVTQSKAVRVGYRGAFTQNGKACIPGEHDASDPAQNYRALLAALSDCAALISQHHEDWLLFELRGGGLAAYGCRETDVDRAAQLFAQGRLERS